MVQFCHVRDEGSCSFVRRSRPETHLLQVISSQNATQSSSVSSSLLGDPSFEAADDDDGFADVSFHA